MRGTDKWLSIVGPFLVCLVGEAGKELATEESRDGDKSRLKDKGLSREEMDFYSLQSFGHQQ